MPAPKFRRDAATWTANGLLTLLTLQISLIGPIMPYLRAEMGLTYAEGAMHTSAFALGMIGGGFLVSPVDARFGRKGVAMIAAAALGLGFIGLILAPNFYVSVIASGFMGLVGSMGVAIAPMILSRVHAHDFDRALAEANLVAYVGGLGAPVTVALASQTIGWRGAVIAGLLTFAALAYAISKAHLPSEHEAHHQQQGRLGRFYWAFWTLVTITVATEFSFIVWSASFLEQSSGMARNMAVLGSTAFPIGMLLGRLAGIPIIKRIGTLRLATFSLLLALIGFALFWLTKIGLLSIAGLFTAGLGLANLYATGIAMALHAAGPAIKKGAERASMASGVAIIASPLILGALADALGLYLAYLIVPLFVVSGLIAIRIGAAGR